MVENFTENYKLPLPYRKNYLRDDVGRIIESFEIVDGLLKDSSELQEDLLDRGVYSITNETIDEIIDKYYG